LRQSLLLAYVEEKKNWPVLARAIEDSGSRTSETRLQTHFGPFFLHLSGSRVISEVPDGSDMKTIAIEGRRGGKLYWTKKRR
jgi:hypothetical protein